MSSHLGELKYEFTSSGILCTNHINCRDQLCVNLDTGELIRIKICGVNYWYEFTSSGILCTNHINCSDQLCVNLDTGELIQLLFYAGILILYCVLDKSDYLLFYFAPRAGMFVPVYNND